uniref:Uncharacterized protein n=1 Tax=Lygus hesperus TaxID=30085 RepID=A0A0A9Y4C0_LYGHE
MASNASVKMDVDNPHTLKRSSSAPMINDLNSTAVMSSQAPAAVLREPTTSLPPRPRRFSTSCSPSSLPLSGPSSPKLSHRVNQLRREESVDVLGREAAHERELNSAMVMSISCEDLTLVSDAPKCDSSSEANGKNGKSLHLSLNSTTGGPDRTLCSTPSPTRTTPLRPFHTYKTSLTPSPTRRFSRSQSPIAMRPATFNVVSNPVKRKFDSFEENEPPAKKFGTLFLNSQRVEEPMVVSNETESRRQTSSTEHPD